MKAYFKQLFEYDRWASRQLLDKFEKQFPQNPRIYELLSHQLSAQRIWLDRILNIPQSVERFQNRLPHEIKEALETYHLNWIDFIEQLEPEDFESLVYYANSSGQEFHNRLVDIITHVINHGTHHRGNIITLMKEEGYVLPGLDFITYVR